MNSHFLSSITRLKTDVGKGRLDDDFADRFNHVFSSLLFVTFTLLVSARQYIGKPIACWVPTEFTRAQEEYAESTCWVMSTYFVHHAQANVPENVTERRLNKLNYYQWVPIVLLLQAFFFNVPYLMWRLFNWHSGMNLMSIMEAASEVELSKDSTCRRGNVDYVAKHIDDSLSLKRDHSSEHGCVHKCLWNSLKCCCVWFGQRHGNYLMVLYLVTKLLYVVNVMGQFVYMTHFIGTQYSLYGLNMLHDLITGHDWEESGNFPRITMCDFVIRRLGNTHRYTVQCVLPINMFNEKIYIFLWFWCIAAGVVSVVSFLYWSFLSSWQPSRIDLIFKFLKLRGVLEKNDRRLVIDFVETYLRQDGFFILKLINTNVAERVAAEVAEQLWNIFTDHPLSKIKHHTRGLEPILPKQHRHVTSSSRSHRNDKSPAREGKMSSASSAAAASASRSSAERYRSGNDRHRSGAARGAHRQRHNEDPGEVV